MHRRIEHSLTLPLEKQIMHSRFAHETFRSSSYLLNDNCNL